MARLVSPEYSFEAFCNRMYDHDPLSVINAACSELNHIRGLYRETTEDFDFSGDLEVREYCENLKDLISMLVNGSIPDGSSIEFLVTV